MITNEIQAISVDCLSGALGFRIASHFNGEQIREYTATLTNKELGADFSVMNAALLKALAAKYGEAVTFPDLP